MKKYLFITGLILLTAMFALAGCGSSKNSVPKDTAAKITVTDDNGRTVSLKDVPKKIVPLSASFFQNRWKSLMQALQPAWRQKRASAKNISRCRR